MLPPLASFTSAFFGIVLSVMAVFMILLVLVQRGRGGGLAGALGGMGGSSAFGAKAGDVFTKITIIAASIWIITCIAAARLSSAGDSRIKVTTPASRSGAGAGAASKDGEDVEGKGADDADKAADAVPDINPSTTPDAETAPAAGTTTPAADTPATDAPPAEPSADGAAAEEAPATPPADQP